MDDDVAEVHQHPFGGVAALGAVDARAELLELALHVVRKRLDLPGGVAACDHDALEVRRQALGVEHDDVAALDVFERVDHRALLFTDVHQSLLRSWFEYKWRVSI